MTKNIEKEAVLSGLDTEIFHQIVGGFRGFDGMVSELVTNGLDWRGTREPEIRIRFSGTAQNRTLEIIDQGLGADHEGRRALTSLGVSQARGRVGMKGKNGSGSKGWVHHAREIVYETVPAPGRLYRIRMDVDRLLRLLFNGARPEDLWEILAKPPDHPVRETGTRVILLGLGAATERTHRGRPLVNQKEDRGAERLVRELADLLPPNAARFIRVEDEAGKTHALQVRKIEGEPVVGRASGVRTGPVGWDAAVVANRRTWVDGLTIGALGTKVTWAEFAHLLRRKYGRLLEELDPLGNPCLSGHVEVPELNRFRAVNSRSFESFLADESDLVEDLLTILIREMLPGVRAAIRSDRPNPGDRRTLLAEIVSSIRTATGNETVRAGGASEGRAGGRNDGTGGRASATPGPTTGTGRATRRQPQENGFSFRGRRFVVNPMSFGAASREGVRHFSYLVTADEWDTIAINVDHPLLAEGVQDQVRRDRILGRIALHLAEAACPRGTPSEVLQEAGLIHLQITGGQPA